MSSKTRKLRKSRRKINKDGAFVVILEQSENDTNINDKEIECIYEKDNVLETMFAKNANQVFMLAMKDSYFVAINHVVFCTKIL